MRTYIWACTVQSMVTLRRTEAVSSRAMACSVGSPSTWMTLSCTPKAS
jgi:hypothetical protein